MTDSYLTPAQKAQRAINRGAEAFQGPCYVCQKMLWMSFFFDAPKHDAIEDKATPDRLTNVGKLLSIHPPTRPDRGIYTIYYNGLQKKLNTHDFARQTTTREIGDKVLEDSMIDKIKDAGKEAFKAGGKIGVGSLKGFLDLKDAATTFGKMVWKATTEEYGWLRDNPLFSNFSDSGVTTRINNAITEFENILKTQTQKIVRIRIAIFGADMGAAIARAFANKLINKHMRIEGDRIFYGEAEVEFMMMGLFDCVSSRSNDVINKFAMDAASQGQYAQGLDEPMGIRPHFRYVYHAVAAHENRPYKRLDSVRKCKASVVSEELFPGDQGDVIGGHPPDQEGRSNQLSRRPLMRMYSMAMAQAVPFVPLEKMKKKDLELTGTFILTDKLVENGIPRDAGGRILAVMQPELNEGPLEQGLAAGARQRLRWLAMDDRILETHQKYAAAYARLKQQIVRIQQSFEHPNGQSEAQLNLFYDMFATELKLYGDLEQYGRLYNGPYAQRLNAADQAIEGLFEQFIHDSFDGMANDGVDQMESAMTLGDARWGYLTPRPVDSSDTFE